MTIPSEKLDLQPSPSPSTPIQKKISQKSSSLAKTPSKALDLASDKLQPTSSKNKSGKLDVRNRKTEALRRLGITAEQMVGVPRITFQLQHAEGGIEQVIEALRGSDEADALAFIQKYDTVSESDLEKLGLEEICVAAGVSTVNLLGVATKALFEQSQVVAGVIAASAHHRVVEKSIQMALRDGGARDREMIHTAAGFLPSARGPVIFNDRRQTANFFGSGVKPGQGPPTEDAAPALVENPTEMPSMDDDVMGMQQMSRKLLEAKTIEAK